MDSMEIHLSLNVWTIETYSSVFPAKVLPPSIWEKLKKMSASNKIYVMVQ